MGSGTTACPAGRSRPQRKGQDPGPAGSAWGRDGREAFSEGFSVIALLDNQLVRFIWGEQGLYLGEWEGVSK